MLGDSGIDFEYREISEDNPSAQELKVWREKSELPLKRFFNTSGKIYKEMGLAAKLKDMSDDEQYELLATDGMLVKRPILVMKDKVLVGPDVKKYLEASK